MGAPIAMLRRSGTAVHAAIAAGPIAGPLAVSSDSADERTFVLSAYGPGSLIRSSSD
jgi:hypothetical protein